MTVQPVAPSEALAVVDRNNRLMKAWGDSKRTRYEITGTLMLKLAERLSDEEVDEIVQWMVGKGNTP